MQRVRDTIGMVFQENALFDSLSVYDNVAYRLHERGEAEEEVEKEHHRTLESRTRNFSSFAATRPCERMYPGLSLQTQGFLNES